VKAAAKLLASDPASAARGAQAILEQAPATPMLLLRGAAARRSAGGA
jgi:hypothetical protein